MNASEALDEKPFVEVVIPFGPWTDDVIECVAHFRESRHRAFRLWLVPDAAPTPDWTARLDALSLEQEVRIHPTGGGNPAQKRNAILRLADSDCFAFIDSDAFAPPRWLKRAVALLDNGVAIVTGPNLTPPDNPMTRRVSGYVMESPLGFGAAYLRHTPLSARTLDEMPTCNMIVRRPPRVEFREEFDTAEDMMFCRDIRDAGGTIHYDPFVVVYHHRRPVFRAFIRQFNAYGRDKGRLFRAGAGAQIWNAAPALLTLYLIGWLLLMIFPTPRIVQVLGTVPLLFYLLFVSGESFRMARRLAPAFFTMPAFVAAHLAYGLGFLRGMGKGEG